MARGRRRGASVPDAQFDVVASVFGAMFAPHPDKVARELFRVTKPGGLVAMDNYGSKGFLPQVHHAHVGVRTGTTAWDALTV